MPATRADMDAALRGGVLPILRSLGFKGGFPHFRRSRDQAIDLLTFQFDVHGGGFVIEIARCPPEGIVTPWGKRIPASSACAHDVHPDRRRRIKAREGSGTDSWFRYDVQSPDDITELVLSKLHDDLWPGLGPTGRPEDQHLPLPLPLP